MPSVNNLMGLGMPAKWAVSVARVPDSTAVAALTDNTGGTGSDTLAAATNTDTLTDSSGGTADDTISPMIAGGTGAAAGGWDTAANRDTSIANIDNNFKEVADQLATQNALNTVLINALSSLSDKVNELRTQLVSAGIAT